MSTRAIVGFRRSDGTIVGAWNWNDGYDIEDDLVRDFKSLMDVHFLLELGMFSTIFSQKEYDDYVAWAHKEDIDVSDRVVVKYGKSVILQDKHHLDREPAEYTDLDHALAQDVNIVYLFENGEWKSYR